MWLRRHLPRLPYLRRLILTTTTGNLNIPRYVDTFEEEKELDLKAVQEEIDDLEKQLDGVRKQMAEHLKELGIA